MRNTLLAVLCVILIASFSFAQSPAADAKIKTGTAAQTSPASGAEMFKAYCASCHGEDAKGAGPAASALNKPLPDLTTIGKRNGGKFPFDRVMQIIRDNGKIPAHGSAEMPVWGPVFLAVSHNQASTVLQRESNIAHYIESLQAK
jgi:mono/diheme cytochrome c family protein